jgi:hypothetical protein
MSTKAIRARLARPFAQDEESLDQQRPPAGSQAYLALAM